MKNFYHENKIKGLHVPKILGLTASPVMRSNPSSVSKIEQTLDAICRTPKQHRDELRQHVKLPALTQIRFEGSSLPANKSLTSLALALREMDLAEDPYYMSLKKDKSERAQRSLEKLQLSQKTSSRDQVKSFSIIAHRIADELGEWAVNYYISQVVSKVMDGTRSMNNQFGVWDVFSAEKQYIARTLRRVTVIDPTADSSTISVTDKVAKLIEVLEMETGRASGIIFVKVCSMLHLNSPLKLNLY